jgi:ABC-type phosphate/phosphonate transport system substrate-binding protein
MTRLAALGMYDLPETRPAQDVLWAALARAFRAEGIEDVPDVLDRSSPLEETWRDEALLFAQICGYPLTHAYSGCVRVVAAPCHAVSGCEDGDYQSLLVVAERSSVRAAADLRGAVAAINEHTSHSGKHALLAHVGTDLISEMRVTGSHLESIAAVARGDADVAAIDCITHALAARYRPAALAGTRVFARTAFAPAPPYVTRASATNDELARLRAALVLAFDDAAAVEAREALLLCAVRVRDDSEYVRYFAS